MISFYRNGLASNHTDSLVDAFGTRLSSIPWMIISGISNYRYALPALLPNRATWSTIGL
ncbi:MAG TPA: hypothetical protein VMZ24_05940 [Patescibacteria group bacterium]|nr:hypothetical protein [Patescibacteria group bacterium]